MKGFYLHEQWHCKGPNSAGGCALLPVHGRAALDSLVVPGNEDGEWDVCTRKVRGLLSPHGLFTSCCSSHPHSEPWSQRHGAFSLWGIQHPELPEGSLHLPLPHGTPRNFYGGGLKFSSPSPNFHSFSAPQVGNIGRQDSKLLIAPSRVFILILQLLNKDLLLCYYNISGFQLRLTTLMPDGSMCSP